MLAHRAGLTFATTAAAALPINFQVSASRLASNHSLMSTTR